MASRFLSAVAAILAIATYLYMNQFEDVRIVDEE
jgi:hypothetical protein